MVELRVPSVQHLARNWHPDSAKVQSELVKLAQNPPIISYNPLYSAIRDLLVFRVSYDQIIEGIRRAVKNKIMLCSLLEIMPILRDHFDSVDASFVQKVDKRYYPIGRGLMVPFDPPIIYGVGGQIYFPWFSFWRQNPLCKDNLSLFVTIVDELLLQDPDLENARFEILDFSAPKVKASKGQRVPRVLKLISAAEVPRLSSEQKIKMLDVFAEGFLAAKAELASAPKTKAKNSSRSSDRPTDHPDLFED